MARPYPTRKHATPVSSAPSAPLSPASDLDEEYQAEYWRSRFSSPREEHRHSIRRHSVQHEPPVFFPGHEPRRRKRGEHESNNASDVWYTLMNVIPDLRRLPTLFPATADAFEEMRRHVCGILELVSQHMIHSYECGCQTYLPFELKPVAHKVRRWVRTIMKTHATRHVQSDAMHTFALNLEMQKILGSFQPDPDLDWIYMRKRPPAAEAFLNTVVRTVNAVRDLGTTRRLFLDQCNEIGPALANIYNTVNKRMAEGYIPWLPEAVTTATRRLLEWIITVIDRSDFAPSASFDAITMTTWIEHFAELSSSLTIHHRRNFLKRQLKQEISSYRQAKVLRHFEDASSYQTSYERRAQRSQMRRLKTQYDGFNKAITDDPINPAWGPEVKAWMRDLFG